MASLNAQLQGRVLVDVPNVTETFLNGTFIGTQLWQKHILGNRESGYVDGQWVALRTSPHPDVPTMQNFINNTTATLSACAAADGWTPRRERWLRMQSSMQSDVIILDTTDFAYDAPKRALVITVLHADPAMDTKTALCLEMAEAARRTFRNQETRRFVIGVSICGTLLRTWVFDRGGAVVSKAVDINAGYGAYTLVSVLSAFLFVGQLGMGFDPTVMADDEGAYMEVEPLGRVHLERVLRHSDLLVGRATTCRTGFLIVDGEKVDVVIKDSWQNPKKEDEGRLYKRAAARGVRHIPKYYHHEVVTVDKRPDEVLSNIRGELSLEQQVNKIWRMELQDYTCIPAFMQQESRPGSSLPDLRARYPLQRTRISTREHRRLFVQDAGKGITEASSLTSMLSAFRHCIEGHADLLRKANILHRDVSLGNLMMRERAGGEVEGFLIDLDHAIDVERLRRERAPQTTGTKPFMSVRLLKGNGHHCFVDDLESFFWVLYRIAVSYAGPGTRTEIHPRFQGWSSEHEPAVAAWKVREIGRIRLAAGVPVTEYFRPVEPLLLGMVDLFFPDGKPLEEEDLSLYERLIELVERAIVALKGDAK